MAGRATQRALQTWGSAGGAHESARSWPRLGCSAVTSSCAAQHVEGLDRILQAARGPAAKQRCQGLRSADSSGTARPSERHRISLQAQ